MMRDFRGNEYGPGDLVIYAAGSGRSITMIIGRVVSVGERQDISYGARGVKAPLLDHEGNQLYSVRIQPLNSSRWTHHDQRPYYVDGRTGEKIDRNKHVKSWGHYTLDSTGEVVPPESCEYMRYVETRSGWLGEGRYDMRPEGRYDMRPEKNPDYVEPHLRTWHPTVYYDYVEERCEGAKPVTLTVTENIVRWNGELPDVP